MKTKLCVTLVCLTLNFHLSTAFAQGTLTPPGAPAPTMKSLDQIEPRTIITNLPVTISSRGSYYLTNHVLLTSGFGIAVTVDDVTIDLNGFTLTGNFVGGTCIVATATIKNLVIRNGTIRRWSRAMAV